MYAKIYIVGMANYHGARGGPYNRLLKKHLRIGMRAL